MSPEKCNSRAVVDSMILSGNPHRKGVLACIERPSSFKSHDGAFTCVGWGCCSYLDATVT